MCHMSVVILWVSWLCHLNSYLKVLPDVQHGLLHNDPDRSEAELQNLLDSRDYPVPELHVGPNQPALHWQTSGETHSPPFSQCLLHTTDTQTHNYQPSKEMTSVWIFSASSFWSSIRLLHLWSCFLKFTFKIKKNNKIKKHIQFWLGFFFCSD